MKIFIESIIIEFIYIRCAHFHVLKGVYFQQLCPRFLHRRKGVGNPCLARPTGDYSTKYILPKDYDKLEFEVRSKQ